MTEELLLPFLFLLTLAVGYLLGNFIAGMKHKAAIGNRDHQLYNKELQIESLNLIHSREIEENKNSKNELKFQLEKIELERDSIRKEKEFLSNELTRRNADFENLQQRNIEHREEVEQFQKQFETNFENLANKILEEKSEKFTSINKQNIQNILNPLSEKIKDFEEKVNRNNIDFIERHAQLGKQLQFLNEQNIKISEEATNLTKALKGDTQMQGNWGEMILERVLERSGLQKDSEYFIQQSFQTAEGKNLRPDIVIHLPGNKKMIVDSKVSLVSYERCLNETEQKLKQQHLKEHLLAVKKRVDELSKKNYHTLYDMESPDFVLLFIPIESAFAMASSEYPNLYTDAFEKNIIIVTPTTLLAVLKTVDSMWQNEKQKQNAIEIAHRAGSLYDSFVNLTQELEKVGRQLGTVQNSYETAMKKLTGKGNLISRVEKLKKLGAKASKQLDHKLLKKSDSSLDELIEEDKII